MLTPGHMSVMTGADLFLSRMPNTRYLIVNTGYDAARLRAPQRDCGTAPVIPRRTSRKRRAASDRKRYRNCPLVENLFCHLNDFRRVAICNGKLAANYRRRYPRIIM